MSVEENKALVRRYVEELWNQSNADLVDEIIAPDFAWHGSDIGGRDGHKAWVANVAKTWPDLRIMIKDILAEGDRVAYRWSANPTTKTEMFGIPSTDKKINLRVVTIIRIVDGLIAEMWQQWNTIGVYRQLGGILTKGESEE